MDPARNLIMTLYGDPAELVEFLTQEQSTPQEPPKKRQKLIAGSVSDSHISDNYVVLTRRCVPISCEGMPFLNGITLRRPNVQVNCVWDADSDQSIPSVIELQDDDGKVVLLLVARSGDSPIDNSEVSDDFIICLMVNREAQKTTKQSGRLWTDAELVVKQNEGSSCVHIHFAIKWEVTSHPALIQPKKSDILSKVLSAFCSDPSTADSEPLSAQDFYQSAHCTNPEDEVPASIELPEVNSTLYSFQKRAVQWLLRREGCEWSHAARSVQRTQSKAKELPVSFIEFTDGQGRTCYVSHLFGIVTFDLAPFFAMEQDIRGGVLAEEMGLGKTLEMIALITLHTRSDQEPLVFDPFTCENVQTTKATLIISPNSIAKQWISEIKTHAPNLKVTFYQGFLKGEKLPFIMESFATSDVVITTYNVLSSEINYTKLNPQKTLRRESKYKRPKSPLMQFSWWRVCLDEAQMVESGVSKAANVARMIPRINAWAITGTPVRKNIEDLLGLFIFLRYEAIVSVFQSLVSSRKTDFRQLLGRISLRHSKQSVREEINLPPQHRFVITMPFNKIEEQYYQELFNEMCEESGLNAEGEPLLNDWDPEDYTEVMRRWLVRLRQATLHPDVGGRNKKILKQNNLGKHSIVQTASKVLEHMFSQVDVTIRTNHRTLLANRLKRGQLYENSPRVKEALKIWEAVIVESSIDVKEARDELSNELSLEKSKLTSRANQGTDSAIAKTGQTMASSHSQGLETIGEHTGGQDEPESPSRIGLCRARLRLALELHHMAVFFRANAYYQIKIDKEMTKPDSPEFLNLDELEKKGYEEAKELRREILHEVFNKANTMMSTFKKNSESEKTVQLPKFIPSASRGGAERCHILDTLGHLGTHLDNQAQQIREWRDYLVQILVSPLVDNDDEEAEINGDEYEYSTQVQEKVIVYVQALRTMVADRQASLTGVQNYLTNQEAKTALREAKHGNGTAPGLLLKLFAVRDRFIYQNTSMRGSLSELRTKNSNLKGDQLLAAESQLQMIHNHLLDHTKSITALEKEIELFTKCMNLRVEYYKQLQAISNQVAPYADSDDDLVGGVRHDAVVANMLINEDHIIQSIASMRAKKRYLVHLKEEAENPHPDQRVCTICRDEIELGMLTVCGHQFCPDCIIQWWRTHRKCPVCKRKLIREELHNVTFKIQEPTMTIESAEARGPLTERSPNCNLPRKSTIYSDVSKSTFSAIMSVDLPTSNSFGTKIDTLARHIIYLRESTAGTKSIIYSQFTDFLTILAHAFNTFRIGHSTCGIRNGVEKFKNDPGTEVLLLHSRTQSAGLTLVNASNVFLCEPLLNTALELQAISRIDRIGQKLETNIWLYLIGNTVEVPIYELSAKRRLEYLGRANKSKKGKEKASVDEELLESHLEEANSLELQKAMQQDLLAKGKGGEVVSEKDIWTCLFGGIKKRNTLDLNGHAAVEDLNDNNGSAMNISEKSENVGNVESPGNLEDSENAEDLLGSGHRGDPFLIE